MAKVKAVKEHFHGHRSIELEDGTVKWFVRGNEAPKVGDEFPTKAAPVPAGIEKFLDADAD